MAATHSVTLDGLTGRAIEVEVDIASGLPKTIVVGLADTIVNEARDRVRAAVVNSGTSWPDQRVTINLAPTRLTLQIHERTPGPLRRMEAGGSVLAGPTCLAGSCSAA